MAGSELSWCYTCNIRRPKRAKHCRLCGVCIRQMDHHCPWINNCVGYRNRVPFFFFVLTVTLEFSFVSISSIIVLCSVPVGPTTLPILNTSISEQATRALLIVMTVFSSFAALVLMRFLQTRVQNIAYNITANEKFNQRRYRQFRDADGRFFNPYDAGLWHNCAEYFFDCCTHPLEEARSTQDNQEALLQDAINS